jgi:hypothetical protein
VLRLIALGSVLAHGQRYTLEIPARPLTVEEWVERYGATESER